MSRAGLWGFLALGTIVAVAAAEAKADKASCAEFRDAIVKMEAESVRPPGWFGLDQHLRKLYTQDCLLNPTRRASAAQYWYTIDGKSTGVLAHDPVVYDRDEFAKKYPNGMPDRPPGAAYATTPEINERCLKTGIEPSVCVVDENLRDACANPIDTQERKYCQAILAAGQKASMPPPGDELPPMRVALDGGPYALSPNCDALLGRVSGDPLLAGADGGERARWLGIMRSECPDFLDALKRRAGVDPDKDAGRFWPAVGDLAFNGFAPPGTPSQTPASIYADPGWKRMCADAKTHNETCLKRLDNMRSLAAPPVKSTLGPGSPAADNPPEPVVTSSSAPPATASQSGAFAQCAALYGQVVNMCKANESVALRTAARMPPPAPKPAPPAAQPKPATGGSQLPPKQAAPGLSPECQKLASRYVAAAQANDGPGSVAGYNALKAAGGCNVLDKVGPVAAPAAAPAAGPDPRFATRRATPGIDGTVGACNASPAECQEAMRQLEAGTSAAARAALMSSAISVGLQLGGMMANGMMMAMPPGHSGGGGVSGGGTDMNSIGNRRVRSTYGEGSPGVKCPPGGCVGR